MPASAKSLRTCPNGHQYYKSSSCPVCPICEKERVVKENFLALLSAPARRALEGQGLTTLTKLSKWKRSEVLALHGMGPGSIPKLEKALGEKGLSFKKE